MYMSGQRYSYHPQSADRFRFERLLMHTTADLVLGNIMPEYYRCHHPSRYAPPTVASNR